MSVSRQETIRVFVNPNQLRRMAAEMEKRMAECSMGQRVWTETFRGDGGLEVELIADQGWFHDRKAGIPDWDEMSPGVKALTRFVDVADEAREFPNTYSGAAWRAAYRIWKAARFNTALLNTDGYQINGVDLDGLGLSGFQAGWALNAVRQMLGIKPGSNPAIVEVGAGDNQPVVPATGPAEHDMRRAIG